MDLLPKSRLYGLDVLRGLAAISVILWHWVHFYMIGGAVPADPAWRTGQPFYSVLFLFYQQGFAGVDLFFVISGFVFFWLYEEDIRNRGVSPRSFAIYRFSRLYPLHLAMLGLVVVEQFVFRSEFGHDFIYNLDDLPHFFAHLLFVQNWPWEQGGSWNGPSWSVSIEVLLYLIFFALARLGWLSRAPGVAAMVVVGGCLYGVNKAFGRGMGGFFVGGLIFMLWRRILASSQARPIAGALIVATAAFWLLTVVQVGTGAVRALLQALADHLPAKASHLTMAVAGKVLWASPALLMPLTVLSVALHERTFKTPYRRLAIIGDLSYSTYLIHFPLQIAFVLAATALGGAATMGQSPLVFCLFFAVLISISLGSYFFFERPMQAWLRAVLKAKPSPAPQPVLSSDADGEPVPE